MDPHRPRCLRLKDALRSAWAASVEIPLEQQERRKERKKRSRARRALLFRRWLRLLPKKREVRTAVESTRRVRAHAEHLAPGIWVSVPPRNKVWHHIDADLPPTLFGAKGKVTESATPRRIDGPSRLQRAQRAVFGAVAWVAGARQQVTVPPAGEGQGQATVLAPVEGRRAALVALSPGTRAVRIGRPGSFDERYVDVRRRFERHVPAPAFSVGDDGAVLIEEWCDGPLLVQLPVAQRLPHAMEVLERYAYLVGAESVPDHGSMWRQLPAALEKTCLPEWLAEPLADERIGRLLSAPLLAPAQGDCGPHNIIIDAQRKTPTVIDFDTADWEPVWLGPMKLAFRTAGGESDRGDIEAILADALDRIWASAGVDGVAGLTTTHWLALLASGQAYRRIVGTSPLDGDLQGVTELLQAGVESSASFEARQARLESDWANPAARDETRRNA